ncbi:MAG: twitching motility protein PilT [Clostridiales bacterium]|nr:twitching motility protein PilT [Clostridiales bacterium]
MVEIIAGTKGKGKTKYLLDQVNGAAAQATGNIVYLDKNAKHMHELTNKVRLINVTDYPVRNKDEFVGFICGIISQDYDLQEMYLDSFLTIAHLEDTDITDTVNELDAIGRRYQIRFILSLSRNEEDLDESIRPKVVISL